MRFPHPGLVDVGAALEDAIVEREMRARRKWNPPTDDQAFDDWCMSEAVGKHVCSTCGGRVGVEEKEGKLLVRCRECKAIKDLSI